MRRSNRLPRLGVLAVLVVAGCLSDSVPPLLAIRAPRDEQAKPSASQTDSAPQEPTSPVTAQVDSPPAVIPDTADGTARAVFQGLRDGHPDVVWDALPASYQRDLNQLVHLAANRLNPAAWLLAARFRIVSRVGAIGTRELKSRAPPPSEGGK